MEKERRVYSKFELLGGNLAVAAWILLGTASFWLFSAVTAIGFLALAAFLVFYELGKKGCLTCYYCETCSIGMGKLPDLFFTKRGTENMNGKALRLFPYVYILLSVVPIVVTAVSLVQQVAVFAVGLLLGLVSFSVLTGIARRKILFHRSFTK
jgi:hypothetical protein